MRIGIVCPYDLGRPGGVQRHCIDVARALVEAGHTVSLIAPRAGEAVEVPGVDVALFGSSFRLRAMQTQIDVGYILGEERRAVRRWMREQAFDVLHFHTPWEPFMAAQVALADRRPARVATFHDTLPDTLSGRALRLVYRALGIGVARWFDRVSAVSAGPAGHLVAPAGTTLERIPPVIDLSAELAMEPPSPTGDGPPRIGFVGRFEKRKGLGLLIEAAGHLQARHPPLELHVVGDGYQRDEMMTSARTAGLRSVHWHGALDDENKRRVLAGCDLLCAPAPHGESFGLVLVEAMAMGLPVAAADNIGYRTVLGAQAAQCLATAGSVESLVSCLERQLSDPVLRQGLSEWGREEARRHDVRAWVPAFEALYTSALQRREQRAPTRR